MDPRLCTFCGKTYQPKTFNACYCSSECSHESNLLRKRHAYVRTGRIPTKLDRAYQRRHSLMQRESCKAVTLELVSIVCKCPTCEKLHISEVPKPPRHISVPRIYCQSHIGNRGRAEEGYNPMNLPGW